jgi:hypothetical protein
MTPSEILDLKRQSRDKWAAIVADLEKDEPELDPELSCEDCGYCRAMGVSVARVGVCRSCPLRFEELCGCGMGLALDAVEAFYDCCVGATQPEALDNARVMLAAIEADVAKDEAALKKVEG